MRSSVPAARCCYTAADLPAWGNEAVPCRQCWKEMYHVRLGASSGTSPSRLASGHSLEKVTVLQEQQRHVSSGAARRAQQKRCAVHCCRRMQQVILSAGTTLWGNQQDVDPAFAAGGAQRQRCTARGASFLSQGTGVPGSCPAAREGEAEACTWAGNAPCALHALQS